MADNEHIPTAPKDVIGDDGDLRTMRDALRTGKYAVLAPDGHVYVSRDPGMPMSEAQESFIESKLGHVIELARSGRPCRWARYMGAAPGFLVQIWFEQPAPRQERARISVRRLRRPAAGRG